MPLLEPDKARTLYHLGYPLIGATSASLSLGMPVSYPTAFLIYNAFNMLTDDGVQTVVGLNAILDKIEAAMVAAICQLSVDEVGKIKFAGSSGATELVTDRLEAEHRRWAYRLCDVLSVPYYLYSRKFNKGKNGKPLSIPVMR